ncbi:MAG: putative bifunctional diguanylate cyclase/phosphodiesterase [Rhodoferax sp.]
MKRLILHRIHWIVAGVVMAFLLAIALATFTLIWQQRQAALDSSQAQSLRFVDGAVAALNRSLLDLDVLLAGLDELLNLRQQHQRLIDSDATSALLRSLVQHNLMLRRVVLLDRQFHVLASSETSDTPGSIDLPANFAARTLAMPISVLTISTSVLEQASASRVVYLARQLKLADGSHLLAVAEVLTSNFTTIIMQGADIRGLEVTLETGDGYLITSAPAQDRLEGTLLGSAMTGLKGSPQHLPGRLSGESALVVAQPILYDDVLIVASIPIQAALANWRIERNFIVLVAALFAIMVLVAGGFGSWYLARLAQARQTIKQSKAEIEHLAFYDHLTSLPNRLLLMERLGHALSACARHQRYGILLFLDLDNFKTINDTLGHDIGDQLLRQVASRLLACVRGHDTVARLGGDEFVVLLEDLSDNQVEAAESARHIGEKLLIALSQAYLSDGASQKSSASIGAAMFGGAPVMPIELLKQADIAMYQAKALGRNRLCFFDPRMQATITAHAELESDLLLALQQQQFMLYFQPQVTQHQRVLGAEVLIRWQHPQRGLVPPLEFIAVAEESDLINQIGQWVLQTACRQLNIWQLSPETAHLQLAVNVSARQFRQADFVAQVNRIITATGIEPMGLKLELTESLVLDNIADTIAKMTALKELGVRFSMDDFGTGQSSLSYLTQLPLNQLKIDQSFVRNIGIKPSDGMIVQTIIGMARNLGLEVIAEGVETAEQQLFLAEHGCTLYQGYLFGKPAPLADFEALLAAHQGNP